MNDTKAMQAQLQPCPFCGCSPSNLRVYTGTDFAIHCPDCCVRMPPRLTWESALRHWNERTPPKPEPAGRLTTQEAVEVAVGLAVTTLHARVLELEGLARHMGDTRDDEAAETCRYCGLNWRDEIHMRHGQRPGQLGSMLRPYPPIGGVH